MVLLLSMKKNTHMQRKYKDLTRILAYHIKKMEKFELQKYNAVVI